MPPDPENPDSDSAPATRGRQRPGAACDECRRRKLRCDGQQPQCSVCRDTEVVCEVTQRSARGPKKGHLKALKNRVAYLEAMLDSHQQTEPLGNSRNSNDVTVGINSTSPVDHTLEHAPDPLPPTKNTASAGSDHQHEAFVSNRFGPQSNGATLPSDLSNQQWSSSPALPTSNLPPSEILQAELDQLYLDRVHQSIPILHQRRYLSWSKLSTKTMSQRCLQYAMWALASLLSSHLRDLVEPLYQQAKQMLEPLSVEAKEHSSSSTALAQAWVLVATFESMRTYHRQAWMSAGRAFRLVQAMRYHEIDTPIDKRGPHSPQSGDFFEVEERRRVFWMAYFLDHVISMRDDFPITLNEHVICTRLPAPDAEFQSGSHTLGPLLSEAMTEPTLKVRSSFNECLILATVCGRSLLQTQSYHISKVYGDTTMRWMEQRRWLDTILTKRLEVLSQCYPAPTDSCDSLLLFANILGQATVIYFCKAMTDTADGTDGMLNGDPEFVQNQYRALEASTKIINLSSTLRELPFSRIHPLTPIPVFLCADFLYNEMHNVAFQPLLQGLFDVLRGMKNVNNPEKSYLDLLPHSCISKTAELLSHSVSSGTPNDKEC